MLYLKKLLPTTNFNYCLKLLLFCCFQVDTPPKKKSKNAINNQELSFLIKSVKNKTKHKK